MSNSPDRSDQASPESITALILRIFRANGALLAAGDRLVGPLGLTSARWQLLGAIAGQAESLPVSRLAQAMGLTRQAVQRIANELAAAGIVAFRDNPHHKRAQLVELTAQGTTLFQQAMALQQPWAASLGRTLSTAEARKVSDALERLLAAINDIAD